MCVTKSQCKHRFLSSSIYWFDLYLCLCMLGRCDRSSQYLRMKVSITVFTKGSGEVSSKFYNSGGEEVSCKFEVRATMPVCG